MPMHAIDPASQLHIVPGDTHTLFLVFDPLGKLLLAQLAPAAQFLETLLQLTNAMSFRVHHAVEDEDIYL